MLRLIFKLVFKILGWRVEGNIQSGLKKCVLIIAPHTSNWDLFLGIGARSICGFSANYLIKKEAFKYKPIAWFLESTGGIPVDRRSDKVDVVSDVVNYFHQRDSLILTLTPEGTRSYVKEWKTGFYRIADRAQVPIVLVAFDYGLKSVKFLDVVKTSGDMNKDIEHIKSLYHNIKGKYPDCGVY